MARTREGRVRITPWVAPHHQLRLVELARTRGVTTGQVIDQLLEEHDRTQEPELLPIPLGPSENFIASWQRWKRERGGHDQ